MTTAIAKEENLMKRPATDVAALHAFASPVLDKGLLVFFLAAAGLSKIDLRFIALLAFSMRPP